MVATTAGPPSPMTPTRKMELKAKEADGDTGPTPIRRLTVGFDAAQAPREGFDSVKGDAYTKKRSKRRSFQQAPEDCGSEVLLQAAEATEAAKQAAGKERDRSYQAKEIYEPDWALSPFPSTVVGTFSCHGIEPSYFTAGATAKINQDRGCVVQPYGGDPRRALFAVFDGHGERGDIVSDYCMRYIRDTLCTHPKFESDLKTALIETFVRCDEKMAQDDVPVIHSGTTAVVAVLVGNKMTIASVGDSRAVLGRKDGTAKDLTVDQNPDHPLEMPRILKAGGFVKKGVDGLSSRVYLNKELTMVGLAMARSLGDRCVKHVGVIAEPAVVEYTVDEAEDAFIIMASDGIWEFVPSQYAVDLASDELKHSNDATAACQELILEGAAKWSEEEGDYRDDITCMVLKVNPLTFLTKEGAAYLPAAADDKAGARTAGAAEKTSNLKMPKGRNTVMLDTKGTGVVDTVGVDTVGDGIADTFYPAKAVDSTGSGQVDAVEVDTNDPRKASNMYGGQSGARASQKAAFASKQDMLAKLVAKVDEDEDVASRASDDFSFAD